MKILITGGYGFIGRHCARVLIDAGHDVVCGGRGGPRKTGPPFARHMEMDFMRDLDTQTWRQRLTGIDVVINAVGAFSEEPGQSLEVLHVTAPRALFCACVSLDVRVINISALGADDAARSRFHLTKKTADDYLLDMHSKAVVLQPSLVYGTDGESSRLFMLLASLPLIPLVDDGKQRVQPVHVDDVAAVVRVLVATETCYGRRIPLVGAAPLEMREYLQALRAGMRMGPARFLSVPSALMAKLARFGLRWVTPEALRMLERGNTGSPAAMAELLGRPPQSARNFIQPEIAACVATSTRLEWLFPLLRVAIAAVWLSAGIVSAGVYPLDQSAAMVEALGVGPEMATAWVYAGAAVDIVLGAATLALRRSRRPWLWLAQIAVIITYTMIISIWLPQFWLHPFGPVVKNIPLLAAIFLLYELERS